MTVADPKEFGTLIRRFRLAGGFSQEQLAERSGLSVRALSDLERGLRTHTRPETLRMLAEGLSLGQEDRQALFVAAHPELRPSDGPSAGSRPVSSGLPKWPSQLIGRDREVAELVSWLANVDSALTTLTGPGGVGKTTLALEAAHLAAPSFPDGAAFVDLSATTDPKQVASAIALTMGIQESGDQSLAERLRIAVRNRRMLLILDNFEQVIEAAPLVGDLVAAAANLRVMVTSREALRIRCEYEIVVEPLELPAERAAGDLDGLSRSAAVELFVTTVALAKPGFTLTLDNAMAVVEICRRLDGLPLAIELAASRVRYFPPATLLDRLDRRLPVLTGGSRDLPVRQQTLRDTIAWSYDLLSPEEQALFRRIGAFPGGATLAALDTFATVAGALELDLLSGLASLVDKNLVRERMGAGEIPRFSMLETIREFAGEMIAGEGELGTSRRAVVAWALEFVSSGRGGDTAWFLGQTNLQLVGEEIDNVRHAFAIAADQGAAEPCALVFLGINGYLYLRGLFQEAMAMGKKVLDLAETGTLPDQLRGRTLCEVSGIWNTLDDAAVAEQLAREGLVLLQRESNQEIDTIVGLIVLVMTIRDQGRYGEALAYAEEADALASTPAGTHDKPWTIFAIGKLSYLMGDQDRAVESLSESMRLSLAFGANEFAVHAGNYLAAAHLRRGQVIEAAAILRKVVTVWREAGSIGTAGFFDEAAVLAAGRQPHIAAMLFAANSAQLALFGMREDHDPWTIEAIASVRGRLGDEAFESASRAGQALSLDAAIELVLDLIDEIEQECAADSHV